MKTGEHVVSRHSPLDSLGVPSTIPYGPLDFGRGRADPLHFGAPGQQFGHAEAFEREIAMLYQAQERSGKQIAKRFGPYSGETSSLDLSRFQTAPRNNMSTRQHFGSCPFDPSGIPDCSPNQLLAFRSNGQPVATSHRAEFKRIHLKPRANSNSDRRHAIR